MNDYNTKEFREKFIEDASGLLEKLESDLLLLENDKENKEYIQTIFRVMHTLKGVASMFGFDNISEYTHSLENIFDEIRNDRLALNDEIFNITFQSVDHLRNLLSNSNEQENNKKQEELIQIISKYVSAEKISSLKKEESTSNKETETKELDSSEKSFYIQFTSSEGLLERGVNIVGLFSELSELGEFKIVNKISIENKEEEVWSIILVTNKKYDEVEDVFMFVLDDCKITKISHSNVFETTNKKEIKDQTLSLIEEATKYGKMQSEGKFETYINGLKEKEETQIASQSKHETKNISVNPEKLDHLMYLVGEFITANSQLGLSTKSEAYDSIRPYLEKMDNLSKQFRNNAIDLRLLPIKTMLTRFRRLVRDLCHKLDKEVDFNVQGEDIELDKNTIDILAEPLMHIIRNNIDHGIELPEIRQAKGKQRIGQVDLNIHQQGNNIFITIKDDGAGIDSEMIRKKAIEKGFIKANEELSKQELLNLIFLPGFSTTQNLTEVSGRGVGMDIVRKKIAEVRGEVEISSELNHGTSFTIKLQQSISILDTMLVKVKDLFLMFPISNIETCTQFSLEEYDKDKTTLISEHNNDIIPIIDLREIIGENTLEESNNNKIKRKPKTLKTVIINQQNKKTSIIVDQIIGEHQAVLKPLGETFQNQKLFTSASILADGEMAFMLNINELLSKSVL